MDSNLLLLTWVIPVWYDTPTNCLPIHPIINATTKSTSTSSSALPFSIPCHFWRHSRQWVIGACCLLSSSWHIRQLPVKVPLLWKTIRFFAHQKNEILERIKEADFDPAAFEWIDDSSDFDPTKMVQSLVHSESRFYFKFDLRNEEFRSVIYPGFSQYVDRPKCDNWLHQLNFFNNWLDTLRDELNSKDLWEEIGKYQSSIEPHLYQETTNDNFTKEEIEKLLSGIEQVKGYLQEHSTASEYQIDSAIAQLDYLAEAANRQGRKDWFHTCIGLLVTISVALAFLQQIPALLQQPPMNPAYPWGRAYRQKNQCLTR